MPQSCETCNNNPVDIARKTQGTPTAKLIAVLMAQGITDTKELAEILGVGVRAVQLAKQVSQRSTLREADFAETKHTSPNEADFAKQASPLARANKELPSEVNITQEIKQTDSREDVCSSDLKAQFNGSTENLICDVLAWMGPTAGRSNAQKWLTTMVSLHGRDVVLASYQQIVASQAKGELIASPISYFSKVATAIKAKPQHTGSYKPAAQQGGVAAILARKYATEVQAA